MKGTQEESIPVVITSPDEVIWQGEAASLSSTNSAGAFDVLPEHANFVTILQNNTPMVIRTTDGKELTFTYKRAIVAVRSDKVRVYVDI